VDANGVITHYWVEYRKLRLKVPEKMAEDLIFLDALADAHGQGARFGARWRDKNARERLERHDQVGALGAQPKRSLKGSAKVGEPQKFAGRTDPKQPASKLAMQCEAFLLEIRSYMTLTEAHKDVWAMLAASYLTEHAKHTYSAYASARERSGKPVDWDFFQSTLRTAYVPRAQVADDLHAYFSAEFLDATIKAMTSERHVRVDDLLSAHKVALQEVIRHSDGYIEQVNDLCQCQLFLAALPACLRSVLKLNEANEAHASWGHLEDMVRRREQQLQLAWATWMEQDGVAKKARVEESPPKPKPQKPFVFGKGTGGGGGGGGGSSGAGPSAGGTGATKAKPTDVCTFCHKKGHWARECRSNPANKPNAGKDGKDAKRPA
jgi:hypothetical protein